MRRAALLGAALSALGLSATPASADDEHPTLLRNSFGEVGIIDMPTARMSPDGQIGITIGVLPKTQRLAFSFQVLPWLEGSFRYSHLSHFGPKNDDYDRSFGMKMRFFQESDYLPEVSLGIRDLIGTGIYGSEYLVASKRFWNLDLSAGIGWGRLSDVPAFGNPFGLLFPSFDNPRGRFSGTGGQVDFGQFFHGPNVGIFGGMIWQTPIDGVDLLVEYSSDKYTREVADGNATWKMPVNFGIAYRPVSSFSLTAGWIHGTAWGVVASFSIDPTKPVFPFRISTPPLPPVVRTAKQQEAALGHVINPATPVILADQPQGNTATSEVTLAQSMMSEVPGVHDFEISGKTLLLDVVVAQNASINCAQYAKVAYGVRPDLRDIAITNLSDPSGHVSMCQTPAQVHPAQLISLNLNNPHTGTSDGGLKLAAATQTQVLLPSMTSNVNIDAVKAQLDAGAAAQSLHIEAVYIGSSEAIVYYTNPTYFSEADAAGRLGRILMAVAPSNVEVFKLIVVEHGIPLRQFTLARSALERAATVAGGSAELADAIDISHPDLDNPVLDSGQAGAFPKISWSLLPQFRQSVFDPNSPYQIQFYVAASGAVDILPGLTATAKIDANIWNNFDTARPSNSLLPHVRSDINQYLSQGQSGINTLMLSYRTRITPDLMAEAKVGYLEDMFAGVGGEVLWRPDDSRLAFGADLYQVWQRGFDRRFDLQNYSVLTGHVTMYYQTPWYGMNFNVGRYLARDYGTTFEVTRRFDSGLELGAYATFTTVGFNHFGEGSFDKGIMLRLPLEWALPIHSVSSFDLTVRSLTRDGGQRLKDDDSLYSDSIRTSYGEVSGHIEDVTRP